MATSEENAFELERRAYQWSMNNTLDDGVTSLLYDGNPNNVNSTGTDGEKKLYSLMPGATYFQSTGELWLKISNPNTWAQLASTLTITDALTSSVEDSYLRATLTDDPTLPASYIDCYNVNNNVAAKLILTCKSETNYLTREVLVNYYNLKRNSTTVEGVNHTQYASVGDSTLVDVDFIKAGDYVKVVLTPSMTGVSVNIHRILV